MRLSLLLLLVGLLGSASLSQTAPCETADHHRLDFWIGEWEVTSPQGQKQGTNRIEKTLNGCAVFEHWQDSQGGLGKSLFYFHAPSQSWKQVSITNTGQVKEKVLLASFPGPGVRFQGEMTRDGRKYLDRTTLEPLPDGRVRQVIEVSFDNGVNWDPKYRWEGIYSRKK